MYNKIKYGIVLVSLVFLSGCISRPSERLMEFDTIAGGPAGIPVNPLDTAGDGMPIFYNMYLSVELSSLFESAGAVFTQELMNSSDKASEYITSSQQAINLGVYAVDLSYARVFDQVEMAGRYFNAMKQLAEELGIPGDYFENTVERFEKNFSNKDSLIFLANEVYTTTDNYLKENERYTTAALIIMGGWIEAMHIAIDVAIESRDPNIIERFIDQKYSLNNLMIMLSEHKKDEMVREYINRLTQIKKEFEKVDISFDANFNPETQEGKQLVTKAVVQIGIFGKNITNFRKELIN